MTKFRASALAWRGSSAILAHTESVESGREILAWTLEALGSLYSDLYGHRRCRRRFGCPTLLRAQMSW